MVVLVLLLVVTNLATVGALVYHLVRPPRQPRPDPLVARVLDGLPPPNVSPSSTRRVISVEILNPIELAAARGRLAGLAGTLAPGLVKRIVYDQTIKIMRGHLVDERVVADLRLHTLRPEPMVVSTSRLEDEPVGGASTEAVDPPSDALGVRPLPLLTGCASQPA